MLKKELEQRIFNLEDDLRYYRNKVMHQSEIIELLKKNRGEDMLNSVSGAIDALAHTVGDLRHILREQKVR